MKKTFFLSIFSFVLGTTITVLLIANPFHWTWMHQASHWLVEEVQTSRAGESSRQLWTCPMHPEVLEQEPGNCPICAMKLTPVKDASEHTGDLQKQLYTCSMHPQVLQEEPGNCPICNMKLTPVKVSPVTESAAPLSEPGKQLWTCGMHPQVLQEEPGFCPICNMKLTPVKSEGDMQHEHSGEGSSSGTVRIDPTFVQNMGIQSEPVRRSDIPFTIRTVGTLTYDDRQVAWINTKYEGWIEKVYVNYVGEPVEKGQKLFEIYSPQLVTTQKEYLQALDYARRMESSDHPEIAGRAASLVESARQRLRYWDITDGQIEELEHSREAKRTLAVTSPVNGVVVEKMDQALEGMHVTPGMNLYKLVDLSTIWVEVEIFENQVPWFKVGQLAHVELPYEPGRHHRGRVRYVYPYFDNKTRTMKASIELPNPSRSLRADMYAEVTIEAPSATNVLTVPEESVIHSGKRNIVVLDQGNGKFEVKEITLGVNGNGLWEVQSGIEEGDRIVVSSQFLIDSESNLQEAIRKMIAQATASGAEQVPTVPGHQH